jgi:hypothetical protein
VTEPNEVELSVALTGVGPAEQMSCEVPELVVVVSWTLLGDEVV